MEPQIIAALVLAEHRTENREAACSPHRQQRLDALRARDRVLASRARADRWRGVRVSIARGIRRVAEAVEPPTPACVSVTPGPC